MTELPSCNYEKESKALDKCQQQCSNERVWSFQQVSPCNIAIISEFNNWKSLVSGGWFGINLTHHEHCNGSWVSAFDFPPFLLYSISLSKHLTSLGVEISQIGNRKQSPYTQPCRSHVVFCWIKVSNLLTKAGGRK